MMPIVTQQFNQAILNRLTDENQLISQCSELDYKSLVPTHLRLTIEYEVLTAYLVRQLQENQAQNIAVISQELIEDLQTARKMALFLAELYQHYLVVPRQAHHFRNEERLIRQLLLQQEHHQEQEAPEPAKLLDPWLGQKKLTADWITQRIRNTHITVNWLRLLFIRSRKLLAALRKYSDNMPNVSYNKGLDAIDVIANPLFLHLAWAFNLPRLFTNLYLLAKHLIPHSRMSVREKNLGASVRLQADMQRRWFELTNDTFFVTAGALNCFVLIGSLAPVSIYFSTAFYAFDLLLAAIRVMIELRRLDKLKKQYQLAGMVAGSPQAVALEEQISFEKRRLYTNLSGAIGLLTAIMLTLPFIAVINPAIPLIGAALLIAITAIVYLNLKLNERTKPIARFGAITDIGFFKSDANKLEQHPKPDEQLDRTPTPPTEHLISVDLTI